MQPVKKNCLLIVAVACICAVPVKNTYTLSKDYTVTINGTSNLHNWNETVGIVTGEGLVVLNDDETYNVDVLRIRMDVHSIKSDMGSVMNNNTYKALKADANPQITFSLATPLRSIKSNLAEKMMTVRGNLTIAGVTRAVDMQVKINIPEPGTLLFEGAQTIKMTDYDIKPPTALLGTLKTGNEITINFKTKFSSK